ncbi:hypothetical protein FACS189430_05840 [Bacteroidia bacterium]|nr:hypothetical protein FACS189430_05840 [Bacteroidia bacterium]
MTSAEIKATVEGALANYATVTVEGSRTAVAEALTLSIPPSKTVVWKAQYEAAGSFSGTLITLSNNGLFGVESSGTVKAQGGNAINATGTSATVAVSGGELSSQGARAIYATGTSAAVTVSGGTVNSQNGAAIHSTGSSATVAVSGGIVFGYGTGVSSVISTSGGALNQTGTGVVIAWDNTAGNTEYEQNTTVDIYALPAGVAKWNIVSSKLGISYANSTNTGFIEIADVSIVPVVDITGKSSSAIKTEIEAALALSNTVVVVGSNTSVSGTLSPNIQAGRKVIWKAQYETTAYTGRLIELTGNGEFEVAEGGTVKTQSNNAIYTTGASSTVTVSGGTVSSQNSIAILATGASSTVTVSGGVVSSQNSVAIFAEGASATVAVTGGVVFSIAANANGVVTMENNSSGYTGPTGTGVVIAWEKSAAGAYPVYGAGTTTHLACAPNPATAEWAKQTGDFGIAYANGGNTGFIKITGVEVLTADDVSDTVVLDPDSLAVAAAKAAIERALKVHDIVTVTGSGTVSTTLILSIPENKKVVWKAQYEAASDFDNTLILPSGNGEFEVAQGGAVMAQGGDAIYAYGASGAVTVSGGVVSSQGGRAIYTESASSTVTVSGGEVVSQGGVAILAAGASSTATVSGGVVFGCTAGVNSVITLANNSGGYTGPTGTGVVIAWDKTTAGASPEYTEGTTTHLTYAPTTGATVAWAIRNGGSSFGISYANGANSGFIDLPVAVVAAGVPGENFSVSNNATKYATLAEAAAAVADGGTITMLQNVTASDNSEVELTVAKSYTIDLGGYTLESSEQYALAVSTGTVTVKNGTVASTVFVFGGKLIVESGAYSGLLSAITCTGGKVMIISGSFSYTSNAAQACIYEFGGRIVLAPRSTENNPGQWKNTKPDSKTVTVTAGDYTPEENFTLSGSAEKYTTLAEAAEDAADGDTITMLKNITTVYYSDIVLSADKTYTIDLGGYTLASNFDNALQISTGRVTVSNGSVTSTIYVPGGRLIVESGSYSGYADAIYCVEGKVTIVSGNFTVTNDDGNGCFGASGSGRIVLAKGSTASADPWTNNASATNVTVTAGSYTPVANFSVSGSAVNYETLAEAAAAVADGDTITMLQAVTASDDVDDITLSVNKTYTIDLGGYTLGSDGLYGLVIFNGTVTISNGSLTASNASIVVVGGELIVESGSYSGAYAAIGRMGGGKVTIISGTFTATDAGAGCLVDDGDNQIVLARGSTASVTPWKDGPLAVTITAGEPVANFSVSGSAMTYETLVEAAEAVANGDTITMLQNVTAGDASEVELLVEKTYTIDFGGYTIGCDEYAFAIKAGTVTFINGNTASAIVVDGGELIVESGSYSGEDDAIYCAYGKVTIISGSFTATNDSGNDGCLYEDGGEIVLSRRSIANIDPWKNDASATTVIVTVRRRRQTSRSATAQ